MNSVRNEDMDFEEETDSSESDINAITAAPTPGPRKRGRKKGVKVGPRPAMWDCAGIVDGELVHEQFSAPKGSSFEELESFSKEDASRAFADEYGVEPDSVHGPYYEKKGGQTATASKKRETVSITMPTLTMKRENAIYKGWKGVAYAIEGRDDVVYFMFGEEVNPSPDKKKSPPTAKTVFRTALEFPEQAQASQN